MLQLFVKSGCIFSIRVKAVLDEYKILFEEKNIKDESVLKELIALGGKKQTPCMVDEDTIMYESQSIIEYLEKKYVENGEKGKKPRIHFTRDTEKCCDLDE